MPAGDDLIGKKFKLRNKTYTVTRIEGQYAYIDSAKDKTCISIGLLRQHLGRI